MRAAMRAGAHHRATTSSGRRGPCRLRASRAASLTALPATKEADAIVVGAGVAGLQAAVALQKAGVKPLVLEAGDDVGGRVRTDVVDGFLLDRGFQIFLTGWLGAGWAGCWVTSSTVGSPQSAAGQRTAACWLPANIYPLTVR
jgi:NADPH-dependent 2,4-dienoyl-CoA reductase/sulfur reductase-like enzyme